MRINGGEKLVCKFVIIEHNNEPWLVVGPVAEFPYHANLVDRYCDIKNVASTWVHKPDLLRIFDADVHVAGGGWLDLDPVDSSIKLYGNSTAYGGFNRHTARSAISSDGRFHAYEIIPG
ncbi:MAG TPA: hypothetical protein PLF13_12400 [candidate division Zixibacteria bacterium]|nr:hypothetical protein [candidate division Zixibacteria bacterium]